MKPVKWGMISTANIGVAKVLPGMLKSKDIEIVAISSRKLKTAQEWAGKLGIPKAYGSYEEMLADPEIEAVYNPLPNHLHVPLTLAAAKAGKHVLCEKPIAITAKEAMQLKKAPKNVFIAEAFMVRHAAQWLAVRDLVKKGKIGEVRAIQVLFSYFQQGPEERPQHGRYRRRRHARHRLLSDHRVALHLRWRTATRHRHHRSRSQVQDRPAGRRSRRLRRRAAIFPSPSRPSWRPISASTSWAPRAASRSKSPSTRRPTSPTAISSRAWT